MYSRYPKKNSAKESKKPTVNLTERLIISMIAEGLNYEEIRLVYPDLEEDYLRRFVGKQLALLGMFPD